MDVEAFNTFELLLMLSFFNRSKSGCAILEEPLHDVCNTLIVQLLFLVDQYLMVHW